MESFAMTIEEGKLAIAAPLKVSCRVSFNATLDAETHLVITVPLALREFCRAGKSNPSGDSAFRRHDSALSLGLRATQIYLSRAWSSMEGPTMSQLDEIMMMVGRVDTESEALGETRAQRIPCLSASGAKV